MHAFTCVLRLFLNLYTDADTFKRRNIYVYINYRYLHIHIFCVYRYKYKYKHFEIYVCVESAYIVVISTYIYIYVSFMNEWMYINMYLDMCTQMYTYLVDVFEIRVYVYK